MDGSYVKFKKLEGLLYLSDFFLMGGGGGGLFVYDKRGYFL